MTKTKQTKLFKTRKVKPKKYYKKGFTYVLLYVGTRNQMYDLKSIKGRFLPKKNYCVRKHFRHFGLFRKVKEEW